MNRWCQSRAVIQPIDAVREQKKHGERESIKKAVEQCIKQDILREYLTRKASEVRNMLIAEYDYEMDIAVKVEEAVEDAVKENTKECIKLFIGTLKKNGLSMKQIAPAIQTDFSLTDEELNELMKTE